MYYPIQLPFLLNEDFTRVMRYHEKTMLQENDFILCFWSMLPKNAEQMKVTNVIIADGCIDLIVDFDQKLIGFSGTRQTDFDYEIQAPARFLGARMLPGAFHQLTGLSAEEAMDKFLLLAEVFSDFDQELFFALTFAEAEKVFQNYLLEKFAKLKPNEFTRLFPELAEKIPENTKELYQRLYFSPRQCQRLFAKNFGLTPKMVLSILRFQKCLDILTSQQVRPADILAVTNYYDQPHFNKDFKHYLGITPLELVARYKN